jgi:hypothetical protein
MGYNGFGMQKWIYTMKPRKFFGKRNNPNGNGQENIAGHEINDYYRLQPNKLENLLQKKYSTDYKNKLEGQIKTEKRNQKFYIVLSFLISLLILIALFLYFSSKFELF